MRAGRVTCLLLVLAASCSRPDSGSETTSTTAADPAQAATDPGPTQAQLDAEAEQKKADALREQAEIARAAAEENRLQALCDPLNSERVSINEEVTEIRRIYPGTYSSLKDCFRNASTEEDKNGCMAKAYAQASLGSDGDSSEGGVDFMSRLKRIADRADAVNRQLDQVEFSECRSRIVPQVE